MVLLNSMYASHKSIEANFLPPKSITDGLYTSRQRNNQDSKSLEL